MTISLTDLRRYPIPEDLIPLIRDVSKHVRGGSTIKPRRVLAQDKKMGIDNTRLNLKVLLEFDNPEELGLCLRFYFFKSGRVTVRASVLTPEDGLAFITVTRRLKKIDPRELGNQLRMGIRAEIRNDYPLKDTGSDDFNDDDDDDSLY